LDTMNLNYDIWILNLVNLTYSNWSKNSWKSRFVVSEIVIEYTDQDTDFESEINWKQWTLK
jgi:hypothetical protein